MKNKIRYRVIYNYIIIASTQLILISWLNKAVAAGLIEDVIGLLMAGAILLAGGAVFCTRIKNTLSGKEDEI